MTMTATEPIREATAAPWYQDAVVYQLSVRAFCDANGDGVGDFTGLIRKLDYLQDLGATTLWLLPFYPSPMKDDGYDISGFKGVHPDYGTLGDFKRLLREAHRRGMRVVTELVLNHTSDQHPWFQRARRSSPGSRWRDFYVWSGSPDRFAEARIIFKDVETSNWTWDPVAEAYYWHRFYHHQPELNYDHPPVREAMLDVVDYWLGQGVDGLQLDGVSYLFQREGTICENLPETHRWLAELRGHVDARFHDRMLLAAANQWPEDAAAYFGDGRECHAAFHYALMTRMYLAVNMDDRLPVLDILQQTPPAPEGCQWMLFLRNHDELTLEMVTEEERDYMYRAFARDPRARVHLGIRRRLAPLMDNNRAKIELLYKLLFSLPGTPVVYYGDEIGMGDNIYLGDRAGVRTPMQWNAGVNAGFSTANPQRLYLPPIIDPRYHYETVNVQAQLRDPHSMLWWMRGTLAQRRESEALRRGSLEFLLPNNRKILAFVRRYGNETVLVVANLSQFVQFAELDLAAYQGRTPVELFGRVVFPPIGDLPYLLTLTPHACLWFSLEPAAPAVGAEKQPGHSLRSGPPPVTVELESSWDAALEEPARATIEGLLPGWLRTRRWFAGKAKTVRSVRIDDMISLRPVLPYPRVYFAILRVQYAEAESERYLMPLAIGAEDAVREAGPPAADAVVARLRLEHDGRVETAVLYDAFGQEELARAMLGLIGQRRVFSGRSGKIRGRTSRAFRRLRGTEDEPMPVIPLKAEHTNSALLFDQRFLMKLFRRLEEGTNPELEIGSFLTDVAAFAHAPPTAGAIEYVRGDEEPVTLSILQGFIANEGNAWEFTLDALDGFFDRVSTDARATAPPESDEPALTPLERAEADIPPQAQDLFGAYLESAVLLGRRTAELHLALATETSDPRFMPEPFSMLYQRSLYQAFRNETLHTLRMLEERQAYLPRAYQDDADAILRGRVDVVRRLASLRERPFAAQRTRVHGDYHLGQVLYTGKDFVIIDFEGEPVRPIGERQIKSSPLRDVAGMLRSFDYACHAALENRLAAVVVDPPDRARLEGWAQFWVAWTSAALLGGYRAAAGNAAFLPENPEEFEILLSAYLVDKALYELRYELNNRPDWAYIPLRGLRRLLGA